MRAVRRVAGARHHHRYAPPPCDGSAAPATSRRHDKRHAAGRHAFDAHTAFIFYAPPSCHDAGVTDGAITPRKPRFSAFVLIDSALRAAMQRVVARVDAAFA